MLSIAPFLVGIANADANSDRLLSVARTTTDYPTARTSLVDDTSLTAVDLETALREDDWEIRQQAAVVGLWRVDPERARAIWTSEPGLTRLGTPGFAGELWRGSDAAPLMLERLIHGEEPAENRAALVGALRHTEGDWSQAIAALFVLESDAYVREVMADVSRHAETEYAWTVIGRAVEDDAPDVRSAALRSMASRSDGHRGGALVIEGLRDPDATVRSSAARTAGVLQVSDAWNDLRDLLGDDDSEVRLNALRALQRLDESRASTLPEIDALRADPESRVRRLAERIARP